MLSESIGKLKRHYGYFIGIMAITFVGSILVDQILGLIAPFKNPTEEIAGMINANTSPDQMMLMVNDMFSSKYTGIGGIITLISLMITSYLNIMQSRSYFQKLNFPEMRIVDSAFFHTSPLKIITLPLKSFFARLLGRITKAIVIGIVGFLMINQILELSMDALFAALILIGVIVLIMDVFLISIPYLIAYDVEGKYNFWSTLTKSISIGKRHFGRILKTLFVKFMMIFIVLILLSVLIYLLSNSIGPIIAGGWFGLIVFLILVLWVGPLVEVYMAQTLNHIFNREY
ncbi:hypothetical protein [Facklamia sp. 7083-14-GEN3]|uniref:hypothetical protein n=1 Tax=Facklamia sp. 7083-14-GEN3 TaxID=2973478 RepID=UPI00215D3162|nr:hypothetical protein [Facklamia sp. 7083-14-GEN3]MCR8969633.1 hypothetical protein [Facklamia sp. 7083-14-GEN3]